MRRVESLVTSGSLYDPAALDFTNPPRWMRLAEVLFAIGAIGVVAGIVAWFLMVPG